MENEGAALAAIMTEVVAEWGRGEQCSAPAGPVAAQGGWCWLAEKGPLWCHHQNCRDMEALLPGRYET